MKPRLRTSAARRARTTVRGALPAGDETLMQKRARSVLHV